jgi:hypothetical protein
MECQHCGSTFAPRRSWARFCSVACRMAAHRAGAPVTHPEPPGRAVDAAKPSPLAPGAPQAQAPAPVTHRPAPVGIVPDDKYPGMFRVRYADGSLGDMLNLSRARSVTA